MKGFKGWKGIESDPVQPVVSRAVLRTLGEAARFPELVKNC